ncbi:MAG: hypothetical protein ACREUU_06860, partial [Gammaproteobacteria bacterium]
ALGLGPLLLILLALARERTPQPGAIHPLLLGAALIAAGPVVYYVSRRLRIRHTSGVRPR